MAIDLLDEEYFVRLIQNSAKCLRCGDEIVSKHVHDFVTCSCGNVSVDGGNDYIRRSWKDKDMFVDTSLYRKYTEVELEFELQIAYKDLATYTYSQSFTERKIRTIKHYLKEWYGRE